MTHKKKNEIFYLDIFVDSIIVNNICMGDKKSVVDSKRKVISIVDL